MEKQQALWNRWPQRMRDGELKSGDYEESVKDYHLYAQWVAWQQVSSLYRRAKERDTGLYFDLPLGVHAAGYDVWRYRDIFVKDIRTGAPPDSVFLTGQDWEFPPLHPENIRVQGYRYVRQYLRHHFRYAAMLRIDHVMGLHRLYWIPPGFDATHGVYVRYQPEEFYAILALESHRYNSIVVGEDLGTVPGYIRPAMARHGLSRMYILYYEMTDGKVKTPRLIPRNAITGLNTHDMAPFASFWEGTDIGKKVELGILNGENIGAEEKTRRAVKNALNGFLRRRGYVGKSDRGTRAALKACLSFLSDSRAHTVLINMEDLWLESQPQNVPGTGTRFPSWLRKARYRLEEFCRIDGIGDILKEVNRLRRRKKRSGK
jgi:4-alpha-glucanotransferase